MLLSPIWVCSHFYKFLNIVGCWGYLSFNFFHDLLRRLIVLFERLPILLEALRALLVFGYSYASIISDHECLYLLRFY